MFPAGSSKKAIHSVSPAGPKVPSSSLWDGVGWAGEFGAAAFVIRDGGVDVVHPEVEDGAGGVAFEHEADAAYVEEGEAGWVEGGEVARSYHVLVEARCLGQVFRRPPC